MDYRFGLAHLPISFAVTQTHSYVIRNPSAEPFQTRRAIPSKGYYPCDSGNRRASQRSYCSDHQCPQDADVTLLEMGGLLDRGGARSPQLSARESLARPRLRDSELFNRSPRTDISTHHQTGR